MKSLDGVRFSLYLCIVNVERMISDDDKNKVTNYKI